MPEKISHEIMSAAYAIAPSCHGFDTALSLAITAVAAYEKEKAKPPAVEETVTATDDLEPLRKRLDCPKCGDPHVDVGNWLYRKHHTHTCHRCHHEWRLEEYVFGSNSGLFMGHRIFAEGFNSGCEYMARKQDIQFELDIEKDPALLKNDPDIHAKFSLLCGRRDDLLWSNSALVEERRVLERRVDELEKRWAKFGMEVDHE